MSLINLLIEQVAPERKQQVKKRLVKFFKGKLYHRNLNKKKLERFIDKYRHSQDILYDTIEQIDPTETGKYIRWIAKKGIDYNDIDRIIKREEINSIVERVIAKLNEDAPKFKSYLETFDKHKDKLDEKDINRYDGFNDLYKAVEPYIQKVMTDFSSLLDTLEVGEDYEFEELDGNYDLYIPLNEKSACRIGVNTQWCTTWGEHSVDPKLKDRSSHFETYKGDLYIFINRNDTSDKIQVSFRTGEIKDPNDNDIHFKDLDINIKEYLDSVEGEDILKTIVDKIDVKIDRLVSIEVEKISPIFWEFNITERQLIGSLFTSEISSGEYFFKRVLSPHLLFFNDENQMAIKTYLIDYWTEKGNDQKAKEIKDIFENKNYDISTNLDYDYNMHDLDSAFYEIQENLKNKKYSNKEIGVYIEQENVERLKSQLFNQESSYIAGESSGVKFLKNIITKDYLKNKINYGEYESDIHIFPLLRFETSSGLNEKFDAEKLK